MCGLYRRKAAGGINIRLFVFHINREPLLFSLIVTLRQLWAGLHLQKALRWKLALTCTQGRRLWYLCCWASIWTPEASCPPPGRSWPDGSLLGGSLEVPAPFWSRGPHHLQGDMKEAQLEKVPVHCKATRRRHKVMYHQRWSKYAGPSPVPQFTSTSGVNFMEIHNDRDAYLCPFLSVSKQTEAITQRLSQHVSTKAEKSFMTPHSAGEPKRVSGKPFKSSICGFLHTSQEQGSELWFEKKDDLEAGHLGAVNLTSVSGIAVFPLKLRQINCAVQWLF